MSMKSSVYYNHSAGNYNGYVNCDKGINVPDKDAVAKEALDFMVFCFQEYWKYPVGYLLDDKVNAGDLNGLLSTTFDLCPESNIDV